MRFACSIALGAVLLAACQVPPTQVVVRIATNLATPDELDTVLIEVFDQDDTLVRRQAVADLSVPADLRYHPVGSFGILPRGSDSSRRFEVRATAMRAGVELFQTRVISGFVRERTIRLDLYLPRTCLSVAETCEPNETCGIAGCVSPEVEASRLPVFDERLPSDPDPVDPRSGSTFVSPGALAEGSAVPREVAYTLGGFGAATIYYTLDGSEPAIDGPTTRSGPAPLTLAPVGDATLRWFGVGEDGGREPVTHTFVSTLDEAAMDRGGLLIEAVDVEGAGPFAEVAAGARVSLSFRRQIWRAVEGDVCHCCIMQTVIEVDSLGIVLCEPDDPFPRWGLWPGDGMADVACGSGITAGYDPEERVMVSFDAPEEPGEYRIRARLGLELSCTDVRSGPGGDTIGVLRVRP